MRAQTILSIALLFTASTFIQIASAGETTSHVDSSTGWTVYTLKQGDTTIKLVPAAGANVQSVMHRGVEYFHQPAELSKLPGVNSGNPILYPTPNRIKGGSFEFEGKRYVFREGGGNHIHGLVNSKAFRVVGVRADEDSTSVTCEIRFDGETERAKLFPWDHAFRMTVTLRDGIVRWDYEVDNDKSGRNLPFGVALHPYIKYLGERKSTYLTVPATSLMESFKQLPSGKLLALDGHRLDARKATSLADFNSDDVFFGMTPAKPAKVEYRDQDRSITFKASSEFTHLVVWTPDRPYMGIENQTCSTDAHNLASQGKDDVAHLQICPPGEKRTGWVEYHFE